MTGVFAALGYVIKELVFLVSYVKNNAFPQPLSSSDEKKYLELMAEDLISIGTIGLIKAIESYSAGKGTKLATYAARCIENEILMHLRALKKTKKDVSLHDPIGQDKEGNELPLACYPC